MGPESRGADFKPECWEQFQQRTGHGKGNDRCLYSRSRDSRHTVASSQSGGTSPPATYLGQSAARPPACPATPAVSPNGGAVGSGLPEESVVRATSAV